MSTSATALRKAAAQAAKAATKYDAKDWIGALELYQSALHIDPASASACEWHFRCGYALVQLSRWADAAAVSRWADAAAAFSKSMELKTVSVAMFNRGVCYFSLQKYEQALTDYNHAIRLNPNYPHAYANRSNVWEK